MIELGTRVINKKLGPMWTGTVRGFWDGNYYARCHPGADFSNWDEHYPDWRSKPIAVVVFDKPVKPLSQEECARWYPERDYKDMATVSVICAVIDDLEEL